MSTTQSTTTAPPTTNLPVIDVHYIRQVSTDWWAHRAFDDVYSFSVSGYEFSVCARDESLDVLRTAFGLLDSPVVEKFRASEKDGRTIVKVTGTYRGVEASAFAAFADPDAAVAALTAQAGA